MSVLFVICNDLEHVNGCLEYQEIECPNGHRFHLNSLGWEVDGIKYKCAECEKLNDADNTMILAEADLGLSPIYDYYMCKNCYGLIK